MQRVPLDTLILQVSVTDTWTVVVTQLVERSLPTPNIHGFKDKILSSLSTNFNRKDENKDKEAGNALLKKNLKQK